MNIKNVEIEPVCCNGDCNQGRDCPVRKALPPLTLAEWCTMVYLNMTWQHYALAAFLLLLLVLNLTGVIS